MTTIGSGFTERTDPAALVIGPTGVGLNRRGTLYVADTLGNRVTAIPDAPFRHSSAGTGFVVTSGGALNTPLGLTVAPGGDILTVNGGDGRLVETTPAGIQIAHRFLDKLRQPEGGRGAVRPGRRAVRRPASTTWTTRSTRCACSTNASTARRTRTGRPGRGARERRRAPVFVVPACACARGQCGISCRTKCTALMRQARSATRRQCFLRQSRDPARSAHRLLGRGPCSQPLRARRGPAPARAGWPGPGTQPVRGRAGTRRPRPPGTQHRPHRAAWRGQDRPAELVPLDGPAAAVGDREDRGAAGAVDPPAGRGRTAHGRPRARSAAPGPGPDRAVPGRAQGVRRPGPEGAKGHLHPAPGHRRARRPGPGRLRGPGDRPDGAVHRRRVGGRRPQGGHRAVHRRDAGRARARRLRAVRRHS